MKRKLVLIFLLCFLACVAIPQDNFAVPAADIDKAIGGYVSNLSIEEKVGQMLMISLSSLKLDENSRKLLQNCHIGSVILYGNNINTLEQTIALTSNLQASAGPLPLFIATDHEGGRVSRLTFGTEFPGNKALGVTKSKELSYQAGYAMGEELYALGINTDLSPVLDVNTNPDNPVIGLRSYGSDPKLVAELGTSEIKGLQDAGVATCAKHFPGHGDTSVDSHLELPVLQYDIKRLEAVELLPFKEAIRSGVDMIMTGHIAVPALDKTVYTSKSSDKKVYLPATLSKKMLTDLLKVKMGFKGVVVTDSMSMKAIRDNFGLQEDAVLMSVNAGADIILVQVDIQKVYDRLVKEVKAGKVPMARINDAVGRVIKLKIARGLMMVKEGKITVVPDLGNVKEKSARAMTVINNRQHKELAATIADKSVTLVLNKGNVVPVNLEKDSKVLLLAPSNDILKKAYDSFIQVFPGFEKTNITAVNYYGKKVPDQNLQNAITDADITILFTCSYSKAGRNPVTNKSAAFAKGIVEYTNKTKRPLTVIAVGDPNDINYLSGAGTFIAAYGNSKSSILAGSKRILEP